MVDHSKYSPEGGNAIIRYCLIGFAFWACVGIWVASWGWM